MLTYKMKLFCALVALSLVFTTVRAAQRSCTCSLVEEAPSTYYFVSASKALRPDSTYTVNIAIQNSTTPVDANVAIINRQSGTDVKVVEKSITNIKPKSQESIDLPVPTIPDGSYRLKVVVRNKDGETFTEQYDLNVKDRSRLLFIQTDKPVYKARDIVRFRVIAVDQNLMPLNEPLQVKIFDGENNLITQFLNVTSVKAPAAFENAVQLSSDPVLGEWKIQATAKDSTQTKAFSVQDLIRSRFDVRIRAPAFVDVEGGKAFDVAVDANYTYGEAAQGKVLFTMTRKEEGSRTVTETTSTRRITTITTFDSATGRVVTRKEESSSSNENTQRELMKMTFDNVDGRVVIPVNSRIFFDSEHNSDANVYLDATFTETSTGYTTSAPQVSLVVRKNPYRIDFLDGSGRFQPGNENTIIKMKVTRYDGKPVFPTPKKLYVETKYFTHDNNNNEIDYSGDNEGKQLPVTPDGSVQTIIKPDRSVHRIVVTAKFGDASVTKEFNSLQSPSGQSLIMSHVAGELKVGATPTFHITPAITEPAGALPTYILGSTNGNLVFSKSLPVHWIKNIPLGYPILLTKEMAPQLRIMVYYVRPDGEVVAQVLRVDIEGQSDNKVSLTVTPKIPNLENTVKPGQLAKVHLETKPKSWVALLGVDTELLKLRTGNDVTQKDVDNLVNALNPSTDSVSFVYGVNTPAVSHPTGRSANDLLSNSGLMTFTNLNVVNTTEYRRQTINGNVVQETSSTTTTNNQASKDGEAAANGQLRKEFQDSFLYESFMTPDRGVLDFDRRVPESVGTWTCSAISINDKSGMAVTSESTKPLKVYSPFFGVLNVPNSVLRSETINLDAFVYNNLPGARKVNVSVSTSEAGANQQFFSKVVTVASGGSQKTSFAIEPQNVGKMTIAAKMTTSDASDSFTRDLIVKPAGERLDFNEAMFIDLRARKKRQATPRQFSREIRVPELPENVVKGSTKMSISFTGDLMGPVISNLDALVRLPAGCGEQNMIYFAPNIYVIRYLIITEQLTKIIRDRLIRFITLGYQSEMIYRHKDFSFSAFGKADRYGSTWLTAFVIRTFAQARQYIGIDNNVIITGLQFLVSKQQENGTFFEQGVIVHKELTEGMEKGISLTAFTLIAFLEYGPDPQFQTVIETSTKFLESQIENAAQQSSLTLALLTYTLHLANSTRAPDALTLLENRAFRVNNLRYWSGTKSGEGTTETTIPKLPKAPTKDILATAYALLTYTVKKDVTKALPIVRWLIANRNANGGFTSTQDTVVGLQALAEYTALTRSPQQDISITVTGKDFKREYVVNSTNSLTFQSDSLPFQDMLQVQATGQGTAMGQVSWSYFVKNATEIQAFDLDVTIDEKPKFYTLSVCANYSGPSSSGMAVSEVELLSGFQVDEDEVKKLIGDSGSPLIKRVEVVDDRTKVNLYFDEIPRVPQCFKIKAYRLFSVPKPAARNVAIYDYYDPKNRRTISYGLDSSNAI